MPRPRVTIACEADRYADKSCERIVSFATHGRASGGGLISIRNGSDGITTVSVYRADANVHVSGPHLDTPYDMHRLVRDAERWREYLRAHPDDA